MVPGAPMQIMDRVFLEITTAVIAVYLSVWSKYLRKIVCAYFIPRSHNWCTLCSSFFVSSHRHLSFVFIKEALDVCIFGEVFNVVHCGSITAFQKKMNASLNFTLESTTYKPSQLIRVKLWGCSDTESMSFGIVLPWCDGRVRLNCKQTRNYHE